MSDVDHTAESTFESQETALDYDSALSQLNAEYDAELAQSEEDTGAGEEVADSWVDGTAANEAAQNIWNSGLQNPSEDDLAAWDFVDEQLSLLRNYVKRPGRKARWRSRQTHQGRQ